jgi:hypothetical protein
MPFHDHRVHIAFPLSSKQAGTILEDDESPKSNGIVTATNTDKNAPMKRIMSRQMNDQVMRCRLTFSLICGMCA